MNKANLTAFTLFLLMVAQAVANGAVGNIQIVPENPTSCDIVVITLSGGWGSSCIPNASAILVDGNDIYFDVTWDYSPGICLYVLTPWELTRSVGPLSPGTYAVYARLFEYSQIPGEYELIAEFTVTAESCVPTVYYVDADNGNDLNDGLTSETAFATIQKAVDVAKSGDTIIVAPGVYIGNGNHDIDFYCKAITVRSADPTDPDVVASTIIDCSGAVFGFDFHSNEGPNSVLAGLTITNGFAGVSCRDYSGPTIRDCLIKDNCASIFSYGIRCDNSSPTITNCNITGNTSYGGGGCGGGGGGGGIYCGDSSPTITNCTISGNSTYFNGGGIYCRYSNPIITNCTISENSTEIGTGGGICCERDSNLTITNCTITGNLAERGGGGIYSWGSYTVVTNCILWDNSPQQIVPEGGAIVSVTYSDVQDTWPGEGNIDENPHFAFSADYHLMPGSPCIDAGTNTPTGGLPATDIGGNPRPLDGNGDGTADADMGAYEYNPDSPPTIAVSSSAFSFYSVQGLPKPAPQTLLIRNCGVGTLNWQIVEDCNWLYVAPTSGISTGNIDEVALTVDHNSLTLGEYSCVFYVLDPDAVNSPVMVKVLLSVGALLRVPSPDFPTIQSAIDAADDYDMVLVADGTYTGPGNCDIDFRGKPVTVKSEAGSDNCIIDWQDQGRGFYFHSDEQSDSIVDGLTITTNYVSGGTGIYCREASPTIRNCIISGGGYGIYCRNSSPIITNCTITDNTADSRGAGIYCDRNSNPTITDCAITANQGSGIACWDSSPTITNCNISGNSGGQGFIPSGGGIYCYYDSNPTITNCTITGNSAEGEGGGIYCERGSNPTITNCTITGNLAEHSGGAISCEWQSSPTITNCTITGNSAKYYGGGITCDWDSNPIITNCTITGNSAEQGGGIYCGYKSNSAIANCTITGNSAKYEGGGICCLYGSLTITNCTITGNLAERGGGFYCGNSNPTITNCTFAQNSAANGNALACDSYKQQYPSNLQFTNCILWDGGNEIWNNDGSTIDITYSNIQTGWPGTGNIDIDPCFVAPGCWADANDPNIIVEPNDPNAIWIEGDYHLYPLSLCINAGDPDYISEPNETDLDGSPRVIAGRIDMGAYESNHIEARLWFLPRTINHHSRQRRILTWLRLPQGITKDDIDSNTPLLLYPGEIEPTRQYIFPRGRRIKRTSIIAYFDKNDLMDVISNNGRVELKVVGRLKTGQYFYGTDTIRIINRHPPARR